MGKSWLVEQVPALDLEPAVALAARGSETLLLSREPHHAPVLAGEVEVRHDDEGQMSTLDVLLVLDARTPEGVDELLVDAGRLLDRDQVAALVLDVQEDLGVGNEHVLGDERQQTLVGLAPATLLHLAAGDGDGAGFLEHGLDLATLDEDAVGRVTTETVQVLEAVDLGGGFLHGDPSVSHDLSHHVPDVVVGVRQLGTQPAFGHVRIAGDATGDGVDLDVRVVTEGPCLFTQVLEWRARACRNGHLRTFLFRS